MASELNDSELLQSYLTQGAEEAFATLVRRHLALVYGAAFRQLNSAAQAQEVTQNVFITLARRAVWLTGHPSLAGWLYRTAIHLAQHEARADQRRRQREQIALELGTTMKTDDPLLARMTPLLDETLLELGAADREALLLRFFSGKSMREVGTALGVRENAAQKRVAKALDALTERFRRRGFRVAGVAVTALALQHAATAAPAGLAALTTQAALGAGAGAASSLGHLTLPLTKIMILSKFQTAVLCAAIAALPLSYEWHSLSAARSAGEQLNQQLTASQTDAQARQREAASLESEVAGLEKELAQPTATRTAKATLAAAGQPKNLYLWDENSPYVRLPVSLLSQARFAPFATRLGRDGKTERYRLPSLAADGSPQPALEAALGLSPEETEKFRQACQGAFAQLYNLQSSHSEMTQETFGNNTAMMLKTAAFADEGAQLRDQFKQQLVDLLGPERTEGFWQQASPMFTELFNDFGAYPRELQLIRNEQAQSVELMNHYRDSANIGQLSQRNGMPLPQLLQTYADTWTQELANQTTPTTQQ